MLQQLRDYWLPLMLFSGALLIAAVLLLGVLVAPLIVAYLPLRHGLLTLFAEDTTVRRCAIAAAIGLIVTAFVFFRPRSQKPSDGPA